jgi:Protein of unknown function DUF262
MVLREGLGFGNGLGEARQFSLTVFATCYGGPRPIVTLGLLRFRYLYNRCFLLSDQGINMSISAQNRTLPDWFTRVRLRQTVLPRFQRFEAWSHANVTQMFNTVLQGLPVGAVLVLEIGDKEPFISRVIQGGPLTGERITEHLLDGQQRLTGLWRGLHNNYEARTFFIYLKP